ncbi:MAG: hypothetical protein LBH91_06120 [Prevotellaceae bacterium]|jgi:hypothetical protein|nr:hypothetical protein [Prevotellaceae bacterium]
MKTEQFIQRLSPLSTIVSSNEVKAMEQFIERYPWCGIARQLYLEALQQNNDEHLTDYIPKIVMYVVHREQLCRRLQQLRTPSTPQQAEETILPKEKDEDEDILLIEEGTPEQAEQLSATEPTPIETKEPLVSETVAPQPKPVFISVPSDYFAGETIEINAEIDPITRFIVERPRITPIAGPLMGIELLNQIEQAVAPKNFEDIVTETLAKIYEDQGLVYLAKVTYEKLCLLKPKKSAYFAARIQNLKFKL